MTNHRFRETHVKKLSWCFNVEKIYKFDEFYINDFRGPKDTPYKSGSWKIRVTLKKEYPHQCPELQFINRIYHPNIDYKTGRVCNAAIESMWDANKDLRDLFKVKLPQLLSYPDKRVEFLNHEAGQLWKAKNDFFDEGQLWKFTNSLYDVGDELWDPKSYDMLVEENCERYAKTSGNSKKIAIFATSIILTLWAMYRVCDEDCQQQRWLF